MIRVAVVTGSRADFGLLSPVMSAVRDHPKLELLTIAAGAHLLAPARTLRDVEARFEVSATVPMQTDGAAGRAADVSALGRGVEGFGTAFAQLRLDWVVVLGDRIEAFAAGVAASVGGISLAHLHGGDVAEGVADEAMRHALTKLAHLHFPATEQAGERIVRMGEPRDRVRVVGSPAIDGLAGVRAMSDEDARQFGDPRAVLLLHPIGDPPDAERERALRAIGALRSLELPALALHPNHDPGREGVLGAITSGDLRTVEHLERAAYLSLLRRLAERGGVLVGNSSGALIEAAALRLPAVDLGERQAGRERGTNVVWSSGGSAQDIARAARAALGLDRSAITHPFGDGRTGERVAAAIASQAHDSAGVRTRLRKRNTY